VFANDARRIEPGTVAVKRIKPNILSERFSESRSFYIDVVGLEGDDGLDWSYVANLVTARCGCASVPE
jgi:hypothetical protein